MLDIALPGYAYRLLQAPAQPLVAGVGGVGAADAGGRIADLRAFGCAAEISQVKRGVCSLGLRSGGDVFDIVVRVAFRLRPRGVRARRRFCVCPRSRYRRFLILARFRSRYRFGCCFHSRRVCQLHRAHHHAGELAHAQIRGVRALE